ncbi:MAG: single-stranded DNA-binding protein [Opitutales bacterium]|nr:single-stranded DNA-binding protein [Opitutales bacterium]
MASFNKVILMGNLTRDPETRVTPNGLTICKFGIAVNRVFNSQDGERREEVTFIDCDAFGRQAETISRYLSKGRGIHIEGRLKLDQWDDRNTGEKRSKLGVVVETFQFVGGRDETSGGGDYSESTAAPARQSAPRAATPPPPPQDNDMEDDVPF